MKREVVQTSNAPRVVIDRVSGDLKVAGWDRSEVACESDGKLTLAVVADHPAVDEADSAALGDQIVSMPGAAELGGDGEAQGTGGGGEAAENDDGLRDAANAESIANADADQATGVDTDQGTDIVTVSGKGDLKLFVPAGASLQVESAAGDLSVRGVHGGIMVGEAGGDAAFAKVHSVSIAVVRGDLALSEASGDVAVSLVDGDVAIRQVEGNVAIGTVGGDVAIAQAGGDVSAQAGGDAALRLTAGAGRHYSIRAGGDLAGALGADSNVTVAVHASSGRMALSVGNAAVERHGPMATIVLGAGEGAMSLDAGGHLALRASAAGGAGREPFEAGHHGERVRAEFRFNGDLGDLEAQISEKFESAASVLDQTLAGLGLSDDDRERVVEKVRSAGERAGARAQSRVARAMHKMERQLERVRERAERREAHVAGRRGMSWSWGHDHAPQAPHAPHAPHPPRPPMPPRPFDGSRGSKSVLGVWHTQGGAPADSPRAGATVTDEERMQVLKMVEEGKITPAQAGDLLAAMEGQGESK